WRRALAHLDDLVTECRAKGTPVAVVLIPDEFQVNPEVLALAREAASVSSSELDLELPQRRLAAFFKSHDLPCLDLLPAFAEARDTSAPRDTHWNEAGTRLAADKIAEWLPTLLRRDASR